MTDYIELALKYGGYTSLDKVYLQNAMASLSDEQKRTFITPPPSVVNAYFAEIYQKQGAKEATAYFLDLSKHLQLFTSHPSFDERKPFIRLNLSGKSYGLTFESDETALIFSESKEPLTQALFWEIAELFPHYKVYQDGQLIKMKELFFSDKGEEISLSEVYPLSQVLRLEEGWLKLSSYNQDELAELLGNYAIKSVYYGYQQRQFIAYIKE